MAALRPLFSATAQVQTALDAGMTVLTPNRRLSRSIQQALALQRAQGGSSAWLTPPVMPREQWLLNCWQRAVDAAVIAPGSVLSTVQERRLWQRIVEEPADGFSLLSPGRAAAQAMRARSLLLQWRVDYRARDLRQQFSFAEDSARFHQWLLAFDAALAENDWLTRDDVAARLLEHPQCLSNEALLLLEGEPPTPLLAALLACAERWESQQIPAQGCERGQFLAYEDPADELAAIARWCRQCSEARPDGRFAVVLQDMGATREALEALLRREYDCLTQRYESLPVNFATGLTLDRVPLVRDALRILALGDRVARFDDLLALLHSRFIRPLPFTPAHLARALERLRELAHAELPVAIMRQTLAGVLGEATPPWESLVAVQAQQRWHRRARPPSQWIEVFSLQLAQWGWLEGRPLDSLEHQQVEHWTSAFESLAGFDAIVGSLSYGQALALLREQLADALFQPRTEDAAIQVLGPLETTGLSFDAVWLAGMNAEQWPPAPRPHAFLPRALQRELRMPHCDAHWETDQATHRLAAWERSAAILHASYLRRIDDAEAQPAALLQMLTPGMGEVAADDSRWGAQACALSLEPVAQAAVPLGPEEPAAQSVGARALEHQAACPFQAFASQRLCVEPPPAPWRGLTPAERGMMLHHALHGLFGVITDAATLPALDPASRASLIDRVVADARTCVDARRRTLLGAAPLAMEAQRLGYLLDAWLEVEASRGEDFRVEEREAERMLHLGGLTLKLRIDRIDLMRDGQRLVIDYKGGRPESPQRWFGDPPARPQLPLYALVEPPAEGVAFAAVRPGEMRFQGLGARAYCGGIRDDLSRVSGDEDLDSMDAVRSYWRGALHALAARFLAGDNAVAPLPDACRRCGRQALCRIAERSL